MSLARSAQPLSRARRRRGSRTCGNVGHFEMSFMPARSAASFSTSSPCGVMPCAASTRTTCALKPHCGAAGEPFMKSTTGDDAIVAATRVASAPCAAAPPPGAAAAAALALGAKSGCDSVASARATARAAARGSARAVMSASIARVGDKQAVKRRVTCRVANGAAT